MRSDENLKLNKFQYWVLIFGFFILMSATFIAHKSPAQTYEMSIYSETPLIIWIFLLSTLLIGLTLSFKGSTSTCRFSAMLLSKLSILLIVTLPLVRGYYHVGEGDSMSHVGWVKDFINGTVGFMDPGYPAIHILTIYANQMTNAAIPHSSLYITYTFMVLFLVFIPLITSIVVNRQISIIAAAYGAAFFLPINLISVSMHLHPSTQAILFTPLLIYLFSNYIRTSNNKFTLLLIVSSLTIIFIHPQQAVNFLLLIGMAAIVQFIHIIISNDYDIDRPVSIMSILFFALFWIWFQGSRFEGSLIKFISSLFLQDTGVAGEVGQRGTSLSELGTGPIELFIKLFGVSMVFCLFAGGFMLLMILQWMKRKSQTNNNILLYLTFGFGPILGIFFAYIVADISTQYFRHFGFMMVIVTILAPIAIVQSIDRLVDKESAQTIVAIVFIILLLPSLLVIHPSPYIFQDSGHVPKAQVDGYATTFDYHKEEIQFLFVRSKVFRYAQFHMGRTSGNVQSSTVPDHFANQNLPRQYNQSRYLTITEADRKRDPILYQGFRYSHEDFQYLEIDSNISRVHSSGQFELYLVEPEREHVTE